MPLNYFVILFFHFIVIFLLNGVLFPSIYFPDQFNYLHTVTKIRDSMDFFHYWEYHSSHSIGSVANGSLLFSLFPILFIDSVYSLALVNTMLYSLIFVFLYKRGYLSGYGVLFYLFFPSLMLYSGIGVRDTWILLFMLFSIYFFINNKFFFSVLWALPLLLIKFQNFVIFLVAIPVYLILTSGRQTLFSLLVKVGLMVVLLQVLIAIIGIEYLDFYRMAFYVEDGGKIEEYEPLSGAIDVLFKSTIGAFGFLLRPFPWEASGVLQLVQSMENLAIGYIVYLLIKKQLIVKDKKVWFLLIYLFVAMSIYGLIIYNFGTAVRYRYTFVTIFIIFSYYILYLKKDAKS